MAGNLIRPRNWAAGPGGEQARARGSIYPRGLLFAATGHPHTVCDGAFAESPVVTTSSRDVHPLHTSAVKERKRSTSCRRSHKAGVNADFLKQAPERLRRAEDDRLSGLFLSRGGQIRTADL